MGSANAVVHDRQFFHGFTTDQMFLDDSFETLLVAMSIPRALWIDDRDGTFGADPQAIGLRAKYSGVLVDETELLESILQKLPSPQLVFFGGAVPARTEEDMSLVIAEVEFGCDAIEAGGSRGVFGHGPGSSCSDQFDFEKSGHISGADCERSDSTCFAGGLDSERPRGTLCLCTIRGRQGIESSVEAIRMRGSTGTAERLVFAIAHEIGNHLGGVRLQAHLLDEDLDARSLAEASVAIDELAARSGPLLALIRPLLSPASSVPRASGGQTWSSLVGRIQQGVEDEGTRGVRVEFRGVGDEVLEAEGADWVQPLLAALIGMTISRASPRGSIVLEFDRREGERTVVLVDDGEEEDLSVAAAECGRPLLLAIARELIERDGGRVETTRAGGRTRVALVFS